MNIAIEQPGNACCLIVHFDFELLLHDQDKLRDLILDKTGITDVIVDKYRVTVHRAILFDETDVLRHTKWAIEQVVKGDVIIVNLPSMTRNLQ